MFAFFIVAAILGLWAIWDKLPTDTASTLYLWCLSFCSLGVAENGIGRAFWTAYVATLVYVLWRQFYRVWRLSNAKMD